MVETRWLRWLGPGVIAVVAIAFVGSTTIEAVQRPLAPPACGVAAGSPTDAARRSTPADPDGLSGKPWFRLDARLDRRGELQGQRLTMGLAGERRTRQLDLPPESFTAGPYGGTLLVGTDDGAESRLTLVNVQADCAWLLGREVDVIRRATVDPAGSTVYEMRVDRTTREDLGIWSRPTDGASTAVRILDPLPADDRIGRTFTTELSWDLDGRRLIVQSCGEVACRTRIVEPALGIARIVAASDLGQLVGLAGDSLVTYEVCPGMPCPIVSTNLATDARTILADDAVLAVLVPTPDGPRLVHEVLEGSGFGLRSVALDGSVSQMLAAVPGGLRLHPDEASANAAIAVPDGWVVLSPDGRLPDVGPAGVVELRRVSDDASVQVEEVAR